MKLSAVGKPAGPWRGSIMGRVTRRSLPPADRPDSVLLITDADALVDDEMTDYAGIVCSSPLPSNWLETMRLPTVAGVDVHHLAEGDVISLIHTGYIRTLYRVGSRHNVVFATDACNSYCLMCSQPPRRVDPRALIAEHLRLLSLIPDVPPELGITGGEPTLLKDGLIEIVAMCKARFPATPLHMLSNGRLFYYGTLARRLAEVEHGDLMVGVPVYSDTDIEHDHIVQARGAFDQTMIGLQNLGRHGVPVEIRLVTHRLTAERLFDIATFVYRNLTFAAHVTFMGLEPMGFAVANLDELWIDPWEYRDELERAVLFLAARGVPVSVYNHQLCTVSPAIHPFCRQSISDWKNEFLLVCSDCALRGSCAGFFSSSVQGRHSTHVVPLLG
jgi:His-Xaa-Ser system radical SAM maturase HxsC